MEDDVKTQGEDGHLQAKERNIEQILSSETSNPAKLWFWTFSLQNGENKFLLFTSSSLEYSVMAALANYHRWWGLGWGARLWQQQIDHLPGIRGPMITKVQGTLGGRV